MNHTTKSTRGLVSKPPFDAICAAAYGFWQQADCPSGRDLDFWLQAERHLASDPQTDKDSAVSKTEKPKEDKAPAKPQPGPVAVVPSTSRSASQPSTKAAARKGSPATGKLAGRR